MLKKIMSGILALSMFLSFNTSVSFAEDTVNTVDTASVSGKQMEYLSRGAFGADIDGNIYLSWRLLGTEPMDTKFNIYCNGHLIKENLDNTNYTHEGGNKYNKYQIAAVINGVEQARSANAKMLTGYRDSAWKNSPYAYFDIPINAPKPQNCGSYSANDASVGDLDSDGEYEIVLKWDPDNAKDNSQSGITGNVFIDAYEMSGKQLWRIDLGRNIRAGAHYTQYIVYDLDGDGKSEIAMKTAPGSKDSKGSYVTAVGDTNTIKNADNDKVYIKTDGGNKSGQGRVLSGPEYLTIFDGQTGEALYTTDYIPQRGSLNSWGDDYGNRADRFLAGVAYLDGTHPSLLMCRGYYSRSAVTAWDWDGTKLNKRWATDATSKSDLFFGQGNHQLSVADLDNDGKDEIIYGSAALDDNGKVLHSMKDENGAKWGHGDALHVSDFDGDGNQEIFSVQEDNCGTALRTGKGEQIWRYKAGGDVGRGIMAKVSSKYSALGWSSANSEETNNSAGESKKTYFAYDMQGNKVPFSGTSNCTPNFAVYWDGDLLRELAEGERIIKWSDTQDPSFDKEMLYGFGRLLTVSGVSSNNDSKKNPCLQADLFGDWREEIVYRLHDSSALRVITSIIPTDYKLTTFMHDSQYRCAVAWQNVGYNQPPHPSYYIGPDSKMNLTQPEIEPTYKNSVLFTLTKEDGTPVTNAEITIDENIVIVTNSEGKAENPILPGEHKYKVKCAGYNNIDETVFTVGENDKPKEITINNMTDKTECNVAVSYQTEDGRTLKDAPEFAPVPINGSFSLGDEYKEDFALDDVIYEYDPNLSDDTVFENLTDDINIKLVFKEKTLPGKLGTEIYRTNFSKDGFSSGSKKHEYTITDGLTPSYDKIGKIKTTSYSASGDVATINTEGKQKFIAEIDMALTCGSGGDILGVSLRSGNKVGPTVGVRMDGSGRYSFMYYYGGSNNKSIGTAKAGKLYRYIIEGDGQKLYVTIGDPETGEVVVSKTEIASLRGITDLSTQYINSFCIQRSTGSGSDTIGLADLRVYQAEGPNNIEWREKTSDITADIPSETDLSPVSVGFKTGLSGYSIPMTAEITYTLKNADGTEVSPDCGVSIDETGKLIVGETALKGNYKVSVLMNGTVAGEYNVSVKINRDIIFGDKDENLFKTNAEDVTLTNSNGNWEFNQSTTGGREFSGEFPVFNSGKATLKFTMASGGTKDSSNSWNWSERPFHFDVQLLNSDYDGENVEENIIFAIQQAFMAKAQEVTYYTQTESTKSNVKSNDALFGTLSDTSGITARSSTNWDITIDFNFDNRTLDFTLAQSGGAAGYKYTNIPISGNFKTLRFVSFSDAENKNGKVEWNPKISNLVYKRHGYEIGDLDESSINATGGKGCISVEFTEPDNGDLPVKYIVSLIDTVSNNAVKTITTDTMPVTFDDFTEGDYTYKVKIEASNALGSTSGEAGPFDVSVKKAEYDINLSFTDENGSELKASEKAAIVPKGGSYRLADEYKEDFVIESENQNEDDIVYEFNNNLSDNGYIDNVKDDTNIELVFTKKTVPGKDGKEIYRTNFAINGFASYSEKHGYTSSKDFTPSYGVSGEIKNAGYTMTDQNITIDVPDAPESFIAEFDMSLEATANSVSENYFGVNLDNSKAVGPTVGMKINGSKLPQIAVFRGTGSNQTNTFNNEIIPGKLYRYIIEVDGKNKNVYMTVANPETNELVLEKTKLDSLRNVDLSNHRINKFVFRREYNSKANIQGGEAVIGLSGFRMYALKDDIDVVWEQDDSINASGAFETSLAPIPAILTTSINGYEIEKTADIVYTITRADGSPVPENSGISVDVNGKLTVSENAKADNYTINCEYNGEVKKTYNVKITEIGGVIVINAENDAIDNNGRLNLTVKATSNKNIEKGVITAAVYGENKELIDVKYQEKALNSGVNNCDFTLDTKGAKKVTLKVFVWDSIENMKPIYETPSFSKIYTLS